MNIKKVFSIILCMVFVFSLSACMNNKEEITGTNVESNQLEIKTELNNKDVIEYWKLRKSFEEIENGKIEKSFSITYSDNSPSMYMSINMNKKNENSDSVISVKMQNMEYSGNVITVEDKNYIEVAMLKETVGKSLFSLSEEEENSTDEEAKQIKKDVMAIYNDAFFEGLNKKYVETTDGAFDVNVNTDFNLTSSESLLKLFELYNSKLVVRDGNKYILTFSNDTLIEEIPLIMEVLKQDTEEVLPLCVGIIEDFSTLLSEFSSIDNISISSIKSEMQDAMDYKVQFEEYKEKINSDNYDFKLYLEKLFLNYPKFSFVSSIEKNENEYTCITEIKMSMPEGIEQITKLSEKVTIDENISINVPSEYNTIEEFMNTPYFAFMNGDMDPFMTVVDIKLKEKYGINYEDILSMYE